MESELASSLQWIGKRSQVAHPLFGWDFKNHSSVVVQLLSRIWLFETPWTQHIRLPSPSLSPGVCSNSCPLSWWCHPTISSSVSPFSSYPQFLPASGAFSNESALHIRWPKYWGFSFSISTSNEYLGLISFRIDYLDLLVTVQGTLKSLLQHHSSKVQLNNNNKHRGEDCSNG